MLGVGYRVQGIGGTGQRTTSNELVNNERMSNELVNHERMSNQLMGRTCGVRPIEARACRRRAASGVALPPRPAVRLSLRIVTDCYLLASGAAPLRPAPAPVS